MRHRRRLNPFPPSPSRLNPPKHPWRQRPHQRPPALQNSPPLRHPQPKPPRPKPRPKVVHPPPPRASRFRRPPARRVQHPASRFRRPPVWVGAAPLRLARVAREGAPVLQAVAPVVPVAPPAVPPVVLAAPVVAPVAQVVVPVAREAAVAPVHRAPSARAVAVATARNSSRWTFPPTPRTTPRYPRVSW